MGSLAFLETKEAMLAKVSAANEHVKGEEKDSDTLVNSNVKWFETATLSLKQVENLTAAISEQENCFFEPNSQKKDMILEKADA